MPCEGDHRTSRVEPRVYGIQIAVRYVLEIDPQGTAEVLPEPDPRPGVGEPGKVEIIALGPPDLVALAVEPTDPASGCEKQAPGPLLVPPLKGPLGRGPYEMVFRTADYGLAEQAEPVAEHEVPSEEWPRDPKQGALNAEFLGQHGIAERRR